MSQYDFGMVSQVSVSVKTIRGGEMRFKLFLDRIYKINRMKTYSQRYLSGEAKKNLYILLILSKKSL
jgi:hypothetical protein